MKKEVVITGMGLICNAGNSVAEFYRSLSSPIFTDVNVKMSDRFNKSLDLDVLICPVDEKELTIDTKQFNNVTNRLGLKAVDECMKDYRLNGGKDKPQCVVVGSSVGGQDMLENFVFDMLDNNNSSNNKNMPINYKNNCNLGSLTKAITDYIDFDLETDLDFMKELIPTARSKGCDVILSYHDFEKTPEADKLDQIVTTACDAGADIVKVSCQVNKTDDLVNLLHLYRHNFRKVVIGMGEKGLITRVAATLLGAEFTFANKITAEEFVARVNRLLRSSLHGWQGGDPALED